MAVMAIAVGVGVAAVGTIGQAYASNKAANQQQKMANIQNARERRMALRSMRMNQRALEGMGVQSGTVGSSSQVGAMGATASATAAVLAPTRWPCPRPWSLPPMPAWP